MRKTFGRFLRVTLNLRRWDVLPIGAALLLVPFLPFGASFFVVSGALAFMFGRMLLDAAGRDRAEQPFTLSLLALLVAAVKLGIEFQLGLVSVILGLGGAFSDPAAQAGQAGGALLAILFSAAVIPFLLALGLLRVIRAPLERAIGGGMAARTWTAGAVVGLAGIGAAQFACLAYWIDRGESGFWAMAFVPLLEYLGWAWLAASVVDGRDRPQGDGKDA